MLDEMNPMIAKMEASKKGWLEKWAASCSMSSSSVLTDAMIWLIGVHCDETLTLYWSVVMV